jgi:hypothetical protein
VIRQIKINIRDRSLLVIGSDDEGLNAKIRRNRKPKPRTPP